MGGSMGFLKWGYTPQNGLFVMEHHIKIDKILGTPNSGTPWNPHMFQLSIFAIQPMIAYDHVLSTFTYTYCTYLDGWLNHRQVSTHTYLSKKKQLVY